MNINALIKTVLTVLAIALTLFGIVWYPLFMARLMCISAFGAICVILYKFYKTNDNFDEARKKF